MARKTTKSTRGSPSSARIAALVAALLVAGGVGGLIWYLTQKDATPSAEAQTAYDAIAGLAPAKQPQCAQDGDCPDGAYCAEGYCSPAEMQAPPSRSPVIGRGRGGEGSSVYLSSDNQRGQR